MQSIPEQIALPDTEFPDASTVEQLSPDSVDVGV